MINSQVQAEPLFNHQVTAIGAGAPSVTDPDACTHPRSIPSPYLIEMSNEDDTWGPGGPAPGARRPTISDSEAAGSAATSHAERPASAGGTRPAAALEARST